MLFTNIKKYFKLFIHKNKKINKNVFKSSFVTKLDFKTFAQIIVRLQADLINAFALKGFS